jgi:hypothetical protein
VPRLCEVYPGICLITEEKARKNLSQLNTEANEQNRGQNEGSGAVDGMRGFCISLLIHTEIRNLRLNSSD